MTPLQAAQDALSRGDFAGAEKLLSQCLATGGASSDVFRSRAACRVRLGHFGPAADDFESLFRLAPQDVSPLELEYARTLRLAQSLPTPDAARLVSEFSFEEMERAISIRRGETFMSIDDFITRASNLAADKYSAAPPEVLKSYLAAKIPGRLYRVPVLAQLPAVDTWARCEWWVFHGLGAADVVNEIISGQDLSAEEVSVAKPPYAKGTDPGVLAERCPLDWPFVHHALIVMAYDLAEELADESADVRAELPAVRDAVVKPLVYLGFGIGLETQGI